jgi:hypothetical protein
MFPIFPLSLYLLQNQSQYKYFGLSHDPWSKTALIIAFTIEFRFYLRPTNLNFLLLIYETEGSSSKRFPWHSIIQFTLDRNLGLNDLKDSDEDWLLNLRHSKLPILKVYSTRRWGQRGNFMTWRIGERVGRHFLGKRMFN